MKNKLIWFIDTYFKAMTFALTATMLIVFASAYLNGNSIIVDINYFGEANAELIMILLYLPIASYKLWMQWFGAK